LALVLVRDLREHRAPATEDELADFETDVLAGFVLARASAGLTDSTIRNDANHLELIRDWFGHPLWEMQPPDADTYLETDQNRGRSTFYYCSRSRSPPLHSEAVYLGGLLASGPPQSSGGVVRARMIRTWQLRRMTGRSKS
jgi:hypothetical protein